MRTVQYTSSLLYSLLILLLFVQIQAQPNCSSSCGEIKNISYPFRLKGDPSGCGDSDYELSCVDNKAILEIFPGRYYVHNISYHDQTIRLVDVNFANGSCGLPSGPVETTDGFVRDVRFRGYGLNPGSRFRDCSLAGKQCVVKSMDKPLIYICEKGQFLQYLFKWFKFFC
ncbi:hypothetical protein ACFX1S_020895 [Malus domestica]